MVARDIALAELTGTPVHIAHVSTAAAVRLLRDAKARGVPVTGEVTPHHLLLTDEALRAYDANAKMAPPLRSKRDVEACREALADGTLDAIATDHAPHALTDKEVELDHAANGIVGLETAVALCLTHLVRERVLDLPTLIARLTAGPARVLGLPGGSLAPGAPGDVTVLDLAQEHVIEPARFRSKARNTPFGGWACVGAPWMTVVGGRVVMRDGRRRRGRAGRDAARAGGPGAGRRPGLRGRAPRRPRRGGGRGRVQHRHERVPGDPHGPLVQGADRLHDVPAHRQHGRERGGPGVRPAVGRGLRGPRGVAGRVVLAGDRDPRRVPARSTASSGSRASTPAPSPGTSGTTAPRRA